MPTAKFTQPDYTSQTGTAYPLNIDADMKVLSETGVDFAPRAADTPNMTVIVEAGSLMTAAGLVSVGAQASSTITAPTAPNSRIDRIVINRATGIINVVTGTPATSPVAPAIPADRLPICQFTVIPLQTSITNASITDERTFIAGIGTMAFQNGTIGNASGNVPLSNGTLNVNLNSDLLDGLSAGNATGNIPVSNGAVNTNLNADMVEGFHASASPGANIIPVHDANGNIRLGRVVGIGTAPDTDHDLSLVTGVHEFGEWGSVFSFSDSTFGILRNAKYVAGNYIRRNAGESGLIIFGTSGAIRMMTAVSGAAGSAITWVDRLVIPATVGQPLTYEGNNVVVNPPPESGYTRVGPGIFRIITSTLIALPFGSGVNIPAPPGATGLIVSLWCSARSANAAGVRFSSVVAYDATGANICGNATARGTELTASVGATVCENYTEMVIPVSGGVARVMFNARDGGNNSTAGYAIVGYTI